MKTLLKIFLGLAIIGFVAYPLVNNSTNEHLFSKHSIIFYDEVTENLQEIEEGVDAYREDSFSEFEEPYLYIDNAFVTMYVDYELNSNGEVVKLPETKMIRLINTAALYPKYVRGVDPNELVLSKLQISNAGNQTFNIYHQKDNKGRPLLNMKTNNVLYGIVDENGRSSGEVVGISGVKEGGRFYLVLVK